MNRKIFLLSPYADREFHSPPDSLNFIKLYLQDSGYEANVIDCSHYDEEYNHVLSILNQTKDPIIGITAYTRLRFFAYDLIRKIRKEIPDSTIVVGGHHFGFLAEETLTELPEVDIVVKGEGEITFKEICDALYHNQNLNNIKGISFRCDGRIVHNQERPIEMDINKFRNFDYQNIMEYTNISSTKCAREDKYFSVTASRGCPNNCVFCSLKSEKVRLRSVDSIITEIEAKIEATGLRNLYFTDSSLTVKRSFVEELCEKIISRKLNIKFNCYSRVNIQPDLLKLMRRAGLTSMEVALETGSPKVLKAVKKNIKVEQFEQFCKTAHNLGIKLFVFCMISLPEETLEDVDMTINLIQKLHKYIYRCNVQVTRIMPDAALLNIAKEKNIITNDFNWFTPYTQEHPGIINERYDNIPIYIEYLTPEEIIRKKEEFNTYNISYAQLLKVIFQHLNPSSLKKLKFSDIYGKTKKVFTEIQRVNNARKYRKEITKNDLL